LASKAPRREVACRLAAGDRDCKRSRARNTKWNGTACVASTLSAQVTAIEIKGPGGVGGNRASSDTCIHYSTWRDRRVDQVVGDIAEGKRYILSRGLVGRKRRLRRAGREGFHHAFESRGLSHSEQIVRLQIHQRMF